jgi:hypothetical protein
MKEHVWNSDLEMGLLDCLHPLGSLCVFLTYVPVCLKTTLITDTPRGVWAPLTCEHSRFSVNRTVLDKRHRGSRQNVDLLKVEKHSHRQEWT